MTEPLATTSPATAPDSPRTDAPWWHRAVAYQVYPRSFADSDGDGIGDLRGIVQRLDHLAWLGVDVLWLSPVYPSPQDDNGYDISDYDDVDPLFGSLADLDDLIEGLHARGMRLVMDLVVNHTSDEHAWFVDSRSGAGSDKRDWYWWRPPRPGHVGGEPGAEPTNWQSFFSGPAWEWDEASGEYYLHLFSRKQPDLNWENPEVRAAVHEMMSRWVDRGVDGFRMDVINLISKDVASDGSLPDGPAVPGTALGDGSAFYVNGPRVHDFLHEMHERVLADRDVMTVGETPGATVADARRYSDPARRELDMVFTFEHMGLDQAPGGSKWDLAPLHLPDLKANLSAWQEGLADVGWNSLYWDNHDQPRVVSRFGDDGEHRVSSAKTLATVLHLMRGTPFVYQGEEIGMTNAHLTSLDGYRDIESVNWAAETLARDVPEHEVLRSLAAKSRDNARTPVQWDAGPQAGFTTGTPWLAVNPNHVEVNVEAARRDPGSVLHHYRDLIALRHDEDVVVHGRYRLLLPAHEQLFAYLREGAGVTLLVVANCSGEPAEADLGEHAALLAGRVVVPTHPTAAERATGPLRLRPWESFAVLSQA